MLVLGVIKLYKTYAVYEEKQSFNVLKGKIASFSKGDLQLAVYVNDKKVNTVPEKSNLYNVEVDCDTTNSGVSGTWDYTNWTVLLSSLAGKQTPVVCNIRFNPVYKIYMGDSTEKLSDFPTKPTEQAKKYVIKTTCDKGVANFNEDTWQFNVTTFVAGMNCDVRFKPMYNITVEGVKSDVFPTKEVAIEKNYAGRVNCTNGTAVWDNKNWNLVIKDGSNKAMQCDVEFNVSNPVYNITVLGELVQNFPTKPTTQANDYAVTTTCTNGSAKWNKETWQMEVTNEQEKTRCDVKFEKMYTITEDGVSKAAFPIKKDGYNYTITPTCTNGTGTWDWTNWRMNENSSANSSMKCNVSFVKTEIWCIQQCNSYTNARNFYGYALGGLYEEGRCWRNGGWVQSDPGWCSGEVYHVSPGGGTRYVIHSPYRSGSAFWVGSSCEDAKSWCRYYTYGVSR